MYTYMSNYKYLCYMQNEMDFYGHCNEFEYNRDLVVIIVIAVVIIIRMNFTQFQFFKRLLQI